jgi:hypothetical protein
VNDFARYDEPKSGGNRVGRWSRVKMTALGHKRTSKHVRIMSALPTKADIAGRQLDVRFVPQTDVSNRSKSTLYSVVVSLK